jgi:protein ImuB
VNTAATLWLAAQLPRLPLEALAHEQPHPDCVVTDGRGSRRWVIAAADARLPAGLELGLARMRHPQLRATERQPAREAQAMETLACAAYGFGNRISFRIDEPERDFTAPRCTLWIEIGASLKLFGGLEPLLAKLDREFTALGHLANFGVAPTLEAAAAFARHGARSVCSMDELPGALAELPLSALALPADALELLSDSGLARSGEVLALPRDALAKRIGGDALAYLDRLTGAAADARRWYRPPARFVRRLDFETEIEDAERLAFPLRRLLGELARYLRARATGVQQFRFELEHARSDGREHPPTVIELSLSAASRDESLLLRVVREKLRLATMPAPARTLSLIAERFAEPASAQSDLFDRRAHSNEEAAAVIDRLTARLGAAAVWRPCAVADHRPEHAWRAAPLDANSASEAVTANARPSFLLREAKRLQRPPPIVGGIESIAAGWWDAGDVRRDYFSCELERGVRGWAYLDRVDGQLYLQGVWA